MVSLIIKKYKQELILALLICTYIAYFTIASFLRYDNFYTGQFDLGNMDQAVWNTINGRIFQTSNDDGTIISRLSTHSDFMLILLSPLYLIWSHPKMLLLIQSFVLGIGGIFVYLIAENILKNKTFALIFGFLFLINPLLQFTNLYDFHAVTLATTFLLASFYFLIKHKYILLILFLILSGITKEQVWVITSLFGFPLLFQKAKKINPAPLMTLTHTASSNILKRCWIKFLGLEIILFSFSFFGYLVWHAIPQNLGSEHFALSYYSAFGNSPTEVVTNIFLSPQKLFLTVFEKSRVEYLIQLFMPLGFLSLLAPVYLIFAIPDLLINLLSNNPQLHQIYYQYSANITPFIIISGIFGARFFLNSFPKMKKHLAIYLIFFAFLSAFSYGPLPFARQPNLDMFTKLQPNKEVIEDFLLKIPQHYSVAATNNLGSHVSHRQQVFTIPFGIEKADMVVFLLNANSSQSLDEEKKLLNNIKLDKNYIEVFTIEDFIAFQRR